MEALMMKKIWIYSLLCGLMIVLLAGCNSANDYSKEELVVNVPHVIYFGNLTEVIVVPEKNGCRIVHEHFNRKHGHSFKVPYSIATVYFTDKKFIISDKGIGNWAIQIDGKKYSLRKSNPVIHAQHGILWTAENFTQGPNSSVPDSSWVFPLQGNISALLRKADWAKIKATILSKHYEQKFKSLSQQEGCIGAKVFDSTGWQKYFASIKNDPNHFEFLLSLFSNTDMTKIHICNWENASQGVLAVMIVEKVTDCSWMQYDGTNLIINKAVERAKKTLPQHSSLKKILTDSASFQDLQKYFRQVYYANR